MQWQDTRVSGAAVIILRFPDDPRVNVKFSDSLEAATKLTNLSLCVEENI